MKKKKAFSLVELSMVVAIIGIMTAGILASSRVIFKTRLNVARTFTESSPVAGIKNLYAWWDTTSYDSFNDHQVNDKELISAWYDINPQSIYKNNTAQYDVERRPTYIEKGINHLPALRFDGRDFMKTLIDPVSILENGSATIFMVFEANDARTQSSILMQPIRNCYKNIEIGHTVDIIPASFSINAGCSRATSSPENTIKNGREVLMTMVIKAEPLDFNVTQNIEIYKNSGLALHLVAEGAGGYNSSLDGAYGSGTSPILIGASDGNNTGKIVSNFEGKIGEIIIYDRSLKNEERVAVEKYLVKKWNIR